MKLSLDAHTGSASPFKMGILSVIEQTERNGMCTHTPRATCSVFVHKHYVEQDKLNLF